MTPPEERPLDDLDGSLALIYDETSPAKICDMLRAHLRDSGTDADAEVLLDGFGMTLQIREGDNFIRPIWKPRHKWGEVSIPAEPAGWPEEHWEVLRQAIQAPGASRIVRGQLGHLLVALRKATDMRATAAQATDAYLELATDASIEPLDRITFLFHARDLAASFEPREQGERVFSAGVDLATALADPETELASPGAFLEMVLALRYWKVDVLTLRPIVDAGLIAYDDNEYIRPELIALKAALTSDIEDAKSLFDTEVERQILAAQARGGLVMVLLLGQALAIAHRAGLPARTRQIRRIFAQLSTADLDFKPTELKVNLPTDKLREVMRPVIEGATAADAIQLYAAMKVLGDASKAEPPAGLLTFPTISFNQYALVTNVAQSTEEIAADRAFEQDRIGLQLWGSFNHEMLAGLLQRDDVVDALTDHFTGSPLFSKEATERIVGAMISYREGDIQAAIGVIPLVESALREAANMLGLDTVTHISDPGSLPSQYVTLGGVFQLLIEDLPPLFGPYLRYWRFSLADRRGLNLRNDLMHGLRDHIFAPEAALTFHILIQVAAITFEQQRPAD